MWTPEDNASFDRDTRAVTALSIPLTEYVLPLFVDHVGGYPEMFGTGFLVEHDGAVFLVSAAHVLDNAEHLYFYVEPGVTRRLSGSRATSVVPDGGTRDDDRFDVGVLKLEGPGQPPYPALKKRAMPLSMLHPLALPREDKQYLIVGFPASKSKANRKDRRVDSTPVSFRNISAAKAQYDELGVTLATHIVLPLHLKKTVALKGKIQPFYSPHGMSGSPMFYLPPGFANGGDMPVVGVVIEHYKSDHAIVATDIQLALEMILAAPTGYEPPGHDQAES
jgi:hypothetical protein